MTGISADVVLPSLFLPTVFHGESSATLQVFVVLVYLLLENHVVQWEKKMKSLREITTVLAVQA